MRHLARQELGAPIAVVAMLGVVFGTSWLQIPANRSVTTAQATVISFAPQRPSKRNPHPPSATLSLRLDDGTFVAVGRSLSCSPSFKPGDRVELSGVRSNAGGMLWSLAGAHCSQ